MERRRRFTVTVSSRRVAKCRASIGSFEMPHNAKTGCPSRACCCGDHYDREMAEARSRKETAAAHERGIDHRSSLPLRDRVVEGRRAVAWAVERAHPKRAGSDNSPLPLTSPLGHTTPFSALHDRRVRDVEPGTHRGTESQRKSRLLPLDLCVLDCW